MELLRQQVVRLLLTLHADLCGTELLLVALGIQPETLDGGVQLLAHVLLTQQGLLALYSRLVDRRLILSAVNQGDADTHTYGGVEVGLHLIAPAVVTARRGTGTYATRQVHRGQIACLGRLDGDVALRDGQLLTLHLRTGQQSLFIDALHGGDGY